MIATATETPAPAQGATPAQPSAASTTTPQRVLRNWAEVEAAIARTEEKKPTRSKADRKKIPADMTLGRNADGVFGLNYFIPLEGLHVDDVNFQEVVVTRRSGATSSHMRATVASTAQMPTGEVEITMPDGTKREFEVLANVRSFDFDINLHSAAKAA